jgi:hypothetical protein
VANAYELPDFGPIAVVHRRTVLFEPNRRGPSNTNFQVTVESTRAQTEARMALMARWRIDGPSALVPITCGTHKDVDLEHQRSACARLTALQLAARSFGGRC